MTGALTITKATVLAPPEKLLTDMTALQGTRIPLRDSKGQKRGPLFVWYACVGRACGQPKSYVSRYVHNRSGE